MDRRMQSRIVADLFAHMAAETTDLAPEEMYQPVTAYSDPAQAGREREALFKHLPLVAAHSSELREANDFVTTDLAGMPVLLVRQGDGALRAFANTCRHRGSRLEKAEAGNKRLFVCPFHAWSYDAAGALRGVPFAQGFCGMERSQRGLIELPVEERHGLVWVIPTPGDRIDISTYLGKSLDDEFSSWGLQSYFSERVQRFEVPVNWKLLVDGFMEDYHLNVLHKDTIGPYFAPNLHTFESLGRHARLVPARANIAKLRDLPPAEVDMLRCTAVVYTLFPSAVLVWQNDHFELWTIFPDATRPGQARATARLLAPSPETALAQKDLWDKNWKILMDTVEREDWIAARDIQAGLATSGETHFIFGRNEPALQHFHKQIATTIAGGTAAAAG